MPFLDSNAHSAWTHQVECAEARPRSGLKTPVEVAALEDVNRPPIARNSILDLRHWVFRASALTLGLLGLGRSGGWLFWLEHG